MKDFTKVFDEQLQLHNGDISAFADWLDCGELNKTAVLNYKCELIEKYAPAMVNSVLASLNGFFENNERYGLKVKNLKVQRQICVTSNFCNNTRFCDF